MDGPRDPLPRMVPVIPRSAVLRTGWPALGGFTDPPRPGPAQIRSRAGPERVHPAVLFGRFWRRQRNDFGAPAALHDGRDPFGRAVGDGAERVVLQMGVALSGLGLTMPEHLCRRDRGTPGLLQALSISIYSWQPD
jgi:hypothetical protein